jgi:iron(III) transport system ATP-binding protein
MLNTRASATSTAGGAVPVDVRGVVKAFGATPVLTDVDLSVGSGSMLALLGPSGCGKTTLLRIIAGLEQPDGGEVRLGDRVVTGPGTRVAPERRRVGMVFQDWALFPHLSVGRNVAYGLPRAERGGERAERALAMVGLSGLGDRMPATLSGGQQQRVALARAIAPEPAVLLLDEPFSNLDAALRVQVRTEVHELLVELGITTLFVTHDQDEAFVLGNEVAVMDKGRVVQQATPAELYLRPATPWVAEFVGDANLVAGDASGAHAVTVLGPVDLVEPVQGPVEVLLRPEEIELDRADAANGDGATGEATIELVEFYGHDTVYLVRLGDGGSLRVRVASAPEFARGDRVRPRSTGRATMAYPPS